MQCYYPLRALWYGEMTDKGKKKYLIIGEKNAKEMSNKAFKTPIEEEQVPCGKCLACRLNYSKEWAQRCMLEAKEYEHNAFITLTYDPEHISMKLGANRETGEVEMVGTLVPEDLTKFMKDLRRYYKYHFNHDNIRFYACGEYGPQTHRPHYHLIVFNLPIPDKEEFFTNANHDKVYTSKIIDEIWGKGLTSVGEVTWNSAAYVARYVMKKIKGPNAKDLYEKMGIVPEFVRMSRKPGIARNYYEENKDKIYELDEIIMPGKKGVAQVVKPARYYDKLYDLDEPEKMKALKEKRKQLAEEIMAIKLGKTSLNKKEYLKVCEANKEAQIKSLKRVI